MSTLVMVVLMVAAFWLLLIRPAQKKQKQQQELVNKLGEDDVKAINAYLTAVSQVDAGAGIAGGSDVDPGAPAEGVPR